jgi:MFS family permease
MRGAAVDPVPAARLHFVLRFSFGTTAALVTCEAFNWQPSALAPVLTGVLLANLPVSPPPKVGIVLVLVMALAAWSAFFLTTLLSQSPHLLFGVLSLVMFLAFAGLAQAKAQLPLTFLLMCMTVVPVVTLTLSDYAGLFPAMLVRGMILAVIFTWIGYVLFPLASPKAPDPPMPPLASPVLAAALGTAIVVPVMLVYLLFGLTDAIPVLLTTVLTVAKMEQERGAADGWGKLTGNFLGGFVAVAAYYALQIAPSLASLALIFLIVGIGFGREIVKGGTYGANALLAYNAAIVIFGLALLKGPGNSGTWSSRVVQFGIACIFAIGMMSLFWPRMKGRQAR